MNLRQAKAICHSLSKPSKMPGYSYGLPARECRIGSKLNAEPKTICSDCYALKGFYSMYKGVEAAQYKRLESISNPLWVDAMVTLIGHYSPEVFRWHDSGDLQSHAHLDKICEVARRLPECQFWLPTREIHLLRTWLQAGNTIPANLCIRLSAIMVDTKPPRYSLPVVLPTSTVHTKEHRGQPGQSIECRAYTRDGRCGPCRACWSSKVQNVSYPAH